MKKSSKILFFILALVGLVILALLVYSFVINNSNQDQDNNYQIANPASTNCISIGGTLEIRSDDEGDQYGVCIKDEKECEEWALYRGECSF